MSEPAVCGNTRQSRTSITSIATTISANSVRGAFDAGLRSDNRAATTKPSGASSSDTIDHGNGVPSRTTSDSTRSLVSKRSVKVTHDP
ncbi:hypothetical protein D3C81_1250570 [compost metagenome]